MLTWKKLRNLRDEKGAGKIPEWFKDIERELLVNEKSQELNESYLKKTPNFWTTRPKLHQVTPDKRKHEMIVFENNKENPQLGKLLTQSSMSKTFTIEHWEEKNNTNKESIELTKCQGCSQNQSLDKENCIIYKKFKGTKRVVSRRLVKKRENKILCEVNIQDLSLKRKHNQDIVQRDESDLQMIYLKRREEELIDEWIVEKRMKNVLIAKYAKMEYCKEWHIYTDGSLTYVKGSNEMNRKKMGIGWIAYPIQEGEIDTARAIHLSEVLEDWPSSTRAELGAIATALLVVPSQSIIKIHSDSANAISLIKRTCHVNKIREEIKLSNSSLIRLIQKCIKEKEIKYKLVKVKLISE